MNGPASSLPSCTDRLVVVAAKPAARSSSSVIPASCYRTQSKRSRPPLIPAAAHGVAVALASRILRRTIGPTTAPTARAMTAAPAAVG